MNQPINLTLPANASLFTRVRTALRAFEVLLDNPGNAYYGPLVNACLDSETYAKMARAWRESPGGRQLLDERPTLQGRELDLDALARLPEGTLGHEFTRYFRSNGIEPFVKTEDGPGWLTHPIDTDRLRDYWVRGPGAAKINWGVPGDFNRCRSQVAKYIKPQHLSGYEQFLKQSIDRNNAEPGKLCSLRLCKYTRLTHDISQECKILIAQIVLIHSFLPRVWRRCACHSSLVKYDNDV